MSSFRLARVGGGYWQVLLHLWLKTAFGRGPYRDLARMGTPSKDVAGPRRATGGRTLTRTALAGALIFVFCALIRIGLVDRHGLWADEFFSLAMATGHSLEHPADRADPALGDYVEAPRALPPAAYSRYLEHEVPPAGPRRVVRAVLLSDTSPPLYYLLLYGWTRALGTGDAALRLFSVLCSLACFPVLWSLARRFGGGGGRRIRLHPLRCLSAVRLLLHGRPHVLVAHALQRLVNVADAQALGQGPGCSSGFVLWIAAGVAGLLTHYFFVFVWIAAVFWLQLHPGRFPRRLSGAGALLTVLLVLPWYLHLPESLSQWRVTGYWLTMRPLRATTRSQRLSCFPGASSPSTGSGDRAAVLGLDERRRLRAPGRCRAFGSSRWSLFSTPRSLLWLWLLSPCLGLVAFDLVRGTYVTAVSPLCPRRHAGGLPARRTGPGQPTVLGCVPSSLP